MQYMPVCRTIFAKLYSRPATKFGSCIQFTGIGVGDAAATILCGYLIEWGVLGGWPAAFYVLGGASLVWFLFFIPLFHSAPEEHPGILSEELEYIESSIGTPTSVEFVSEVDLWLRHACAPC